MRLLPVVLIVLAVPACLPAFAQNTLEIIPLRHRTVDQVLPVLRPLLEPGGALSGQSTQLIVRTSPRNLAEIKAALDAIDTPSRRLLVSVRFDDAQSTSREAITAAGTITSGDGSRVTLRAGRSDASLEERVDQRVQVLEGGRAYISTGTSRPLRERQVVRTPGGTVTSETTTIQELATGFEVVPHVSGGNVILDIDPQRETPGALPGRVRGERIVTTASGRLGEWFEIGAAVERSAGDARGVLSSRAARTGAGRHIWVKVEEIRP
jgi:type II secretory pathway component GspD/PulD (secretin)